jgi:polyribonucleotide nucleotidyltransferase
MDLKVAGDESGITALQLDVKNDGLTMELLTQALQQVPHCCLISLTCKARLFTSTPVCLPL